VASDDAPDFDDDGLPIGSELDAADTKIIDRLLSLARSRDKPTIIDMPASGHVVCAFFNALLDRDLRIALGLDTATCKRVDRIAANLLPRATSEDILPPPSDDEDAPD
jgi:hypothetical protein